MCAWCALLNCLAISSLQDDLGTFSDLEYCKTDLISAKGVVFCKFTKASSALKALEDITVRGTVRMNPLHQVLCRVYAPCPDAQCP